MARISSAAFDDPGALGKQLGEPDRWPVTGQQPGGHGAELLDPTGEQLGLEVADSRQELNQQSAGVVDPGVRMDVDAQQHGRRDLLRVVEVVGEVSSDLSSANRNHVVLSTP